MSKLDNRAVARMYVEALPTNFEVLASLQHDDFVQEFPQSGEVIRGTANFRAAHEIYPGGSPEDRVQSLIGTEDRGSALIRNLTTATGITHSAMRENWRSF
jgi:hypothetical protein